MTGDDLEYIKKLLENKVILSPVLELGAGYGGMTCKEIIESHGLEYYSTDLSQQSEVNFIIDFESGNGLEQLYEIGSFGSVLVLNVLEHTFNPISVLDNVRKLISSSGNIVVITPSVWPIHNFPHDFYRILPDFYLKYAATRNLTIDNQYFMYIGIGPISDYKSLSGQFHFPLPSPLKPTYRIYSKIIHKIFNTFGRGMSSPAHLAIGVVMMNHVNNDHLH